MDLLTHLVVWLNAVANLLGRFLLAPIALCPGWLSATLISVASGVLFLLAFKYTSNQQAIKRVKDDIKANLLTLKLYKDSARLAVRAQGNIVWGGVRLLFLSLSPMVVMIVPVLLILGQLALWYQARPLRENEEAVITLKLRPDDPELVQSVHLEPTSALKTTVGPVHVGSKREICWKVQAIQSGYHHLRFQAGDHLGQKELAVGDGFMRVSPLRPGWQWSDVLLNPWEKPFPAESPIESIAIQYPTRDSKISGTDYWVFYWFIVSLVAGFCLRRPLHVNI